MVARSQIEGDEPEFAAQVRQVFDAHLHKTIATLRADGAPRISGTEATFNGGELWLGMKERSRKARDLLRDSRVAVYSATVDSEMVDGDAKVLAVAVRESAQAARDAGFEDVPTDSAFVRLDLLEVTLTRVETIRRVPRLLIFSWNAADGLRAMRGI